MHLFIRHWRHEHIRGVTVSRNRAIQVIIFLHTNLFVCVYRLSSLFCGLDESSSLRYTVYMTLIKLAGHANLMHVVNPKLEEIKSWLSVWDVGAAKGQALLRTLYDAFTECKMRCYSCTNYGIRCHLFACLSTCFSKSVWRS